MFENIKEVKSIEEYNQLVNGKSERRPSQSDTCSQERADDVKEQEKSHNVGEVSSLHGKNLIVNGGSCVEKSPASNSKEDKPKSWDEFANKVNKIFKENKTDYKVIKEGEEYRTVKKSSFLFFKILSIVALLIIIVASGTFLYLMQDGKFQSLVNNTMSCPSINIPNCPTISCPNCSCPACPSLNCNSSTPLIKLDLANLNCTTK